MILVSPEPEITAILGRRDVRLLHETRPAGLNAAAVFAAAELAAAGRERALFLPADLPLIRSEDIEAVIEAHSRSATDVIVPSTDESGTNALFVELPPRFQFAFGPDSFNRHLANAAHGTAGWSSTGARISASTSTGPRTCGISLGMVA